MGRRGTLAGLVALVAACQTGPQQAASLTIGADRVGYMLFRSPITDQTRQFFTSNIGTMVEKGATEIHIGISSPGGRIDAAQAMLNAMDRLHTDRGVTFVTHNIGAVASAACYVYLAGQRRLSVARGAFLFHDATLTGSGNIMTAEMVRQAYAELERNEGTFRQLLRTRTKLSDGAIDTFLHRTVILTADEARRDGVTDAIGEFVVPPGATVVDIRPNSGAPPLRSAPSTGG